ncbi:MAG: FAD-dependent monooxygenase [Deltaproteobacteria bacterium]|nr:FAD-dependent monooxygenase [Deltaproteobacteria bacterium]
MKKEIRLTLPPKIAYEESLLKNVVCEKLSLSLQDKLVFRITHRDIDARSREIKVNLTLDAYIDESPPSLFVPEFKNVAREQEALIVGAGPAGLFAALRFLELGIRPVIIERGKDVSKRTNDLNDLFTRRILNPESNFCFGEGGAGAYSDGKLYTRSGKRGNVRNVLAMLVGFGAKEDILYDSRPHIGSDKLPEIISSMRKTIIESGGVIRFESKCTDLLIEDDEIRGIKINDNETVKGIGVVLATGHSARDIYELLQRKQIRIEAKPFAVGLRVEHPQSIVDAMQYHSGTRDPLLPPASYFLAAQTHIDGHKRGVFTFCMCPGGSIVPSATAPGEIVVNGMSNSSRDSKYANSGIVTSIDMEDLAKYGRWGALSGVCLQREIETRAFEMAGKNFKAPAQGLIDFVGQKQRGSSLESSYALGIEYTDLNAVLPDFVARRLREGLKEFEKKRKGFLCDEAVLVGVETRTSSPIRIPRDPATFEHVQVKRLYPCGEGSGYAGGIVSSAMDGIRSADCLAKVNHCQLKPTA